MQTKRKECCCELRFMVIHPHETLITTKKPNLIKKARDLYSKPWLPNYCSRIIEHRRVEVWIELSSMTLHVLLLKWESEDHSKPTTPLVMWRSSSLFMASEFEVYKLCILLFTWELRKDFGIIHQTSRTLVYGNTGF